MSVDGRIAIGGLTNVGTNTFVGDQKEMNPSAKFQINGYGTLPTTRNAALFLNASTKGGHPAVLFGHNNAINWSVKSIMIRLLPLFSIIILVLMKIISHLQI